LIQPHWWNKSAVRRCAICHPTCQIIPWMGLDRYWMASFLWWLASHKEKRTVSLNRDLASLCWKKRISNLQKLQSVPPIAPPNCAMATHNVQNSYTWTYHHAARVLQNMKKKEKKDCSMKF
jgi:hypothetical protein